jgi:hypothetical protein
MSVEVDPRSSTEFSSDYCAINSSDHDYWISSQFGTNIKFYLKQMKPVYYILGNKCTIDFRSYSQNRRGRPGGRPGANDNSSDMNRWGIKLIFRPIYAQPINYLRNQIN